MASARDDLLAHVRAWRRTEAFPDSAFAVESGIDADELAAFDAGEAPVPADVLAAMLGVVSRGSSSTPAPGFSEAPQSPLTRSGDEKQFAETIVLVRAFSSIASDADRQAVIALAAASADRAQRRG